MSVKTQPRIEAPVEPPLDYEAFLAKLGAKDRLNAEKHVAACAAGPEPLHAPLWQRLVCSLMSLSRHSAKLNGQQSAQFYVADGKYRMQVFALEDRRLGELGVFCGDVLEQAVQAGILVSAKPGPANDYPIAKSAEKLTINRLDADTPSPMPFFKDMVGWHRKALHVVLSVSATATQVRAVEALCALSAAKWHALTAIPRVLPVRV